MTRRNWTVFAAMLIAASALVLAGCGGDDNGGLSAEDMARIAAAETAAAAAQAEADAAQADAEMAHEEAHAAEEAAAAALAEAEQAKMDAAAAQAEADAAKEAAEAEPDTSAIDAAAEKIEELEQTVADLTAVPLTIPEILGGMKDAKSAADLAAAGAKVRGELLARYDDNGDAGMVNLVELPRDGTTAETAAPLIDAKTRNVTWASKVGGGSLLMGGDVDLSSPGDLATLKLGNLLTVDGVTLQKLTVGETDKVMMEAGHLGANGTDDFTAEDAGTNVPATRTTTLGADGSETVVVTNNVTGMQVSSMTTEFVGGMKIQEYTGAAVDTGVAARITLADGRTRTWTAAADTTLDYTGGTLTAAAPGTDGSVAQDLNVALRNYASSTVAIAQDLATGYGGWLEDSFFLAYTLMSEDDSKRNDPDSFTYKSVHGGRTHDAAMATDLSGRGDTAVWKGMMVGHDLDADKGATYGQMLKGNAMITAHLAPATLADQSGTQADMVSLVDVALTNIINDKGEASRVPYLMWTNLDLNGADRGGDPVSFAKGSEIMGYFYDDGNEVVGEFNKDDIVGVFGAVEYEMMDDDMMASQ